MVLRLVQQLAPALGVVLMAPDAGQQGRAEKATALRRALLDKAFGQHRERCTRGQPEPPALLVAAWINKPKPAAAPPGHLKNNFRGRA